MVFVLVTPDSSLPSAELLLNDISNKIGSVIFSHTETWTFGQAMYFCESFKFRITHQYKPQTGFIAFTTIGYGDFAPETALGRSIFVFWALFGVGTMTVLIAGRLRLLATFSFLAQCALVLTDTFSSKYRHMTHKNKTFDRAVDRYRQGQDQSRRVTVEKCAKDRPLSEMLQANLAKMSSPQRARPLSASQPKLTLEEADACLRERIEPLPTMILKEVVKFRENTRYFFIAGGHADALSLPSDPREKSGISFPQENVVPEELKKLLDEVAQEEGFDERLKQEVWDDEHARNVSLSLRQRK